MRDLGFAADLRTCLALRDARAAENAEARRRAKANVELCAHLAADAKRRGLPGIDWAEYFRSTGVNYP